MHDHFDIRLLRRTLGATRKDRSVKTLYGDKTWVEDLDIVNELGAHTGCVNALSWSTSGNLLASGSDDTYLNIWEYSPIGSAKPFSLNTSVNTGHHANIFSVKFMPHSGDRTVVTCAGDSEVRVFDLEHGGAATQAGSNETFSTSTRSQRFNSHFPNARWLGEANTNCRVYRSHADRAKRIVTESSPYLFLTCSEDGEVRQWDLRQPSSTYPAPRGGRRSRFYAAADPDGGDAPPPLISYKKYSLDLNSISCAASQPQYIALAGAHLHCFLHDRRMLGRDLDSEKGRISAHHPAAGTLEDEAMAQATKCVRRFAPNNRRKPGPRESAHITACKISDANPNDLVASWSGDHIYSFDIVKSPDARDSDAMADEQQVRRSRNLTDRKRKRVKADVSSSSIAESATPGRRLRRVPDDQQEDGHTALLPGHINGVPDTSPSLEDGVQPESQSTSGPLLSEIERASERVARSLTRLRKTLFDFSASLNEEDASATQQQPPPLTSYTSKFTDTLGQCASLLPQMDEIIRTWTYPINPAEEDVTLQNTLRRNRHSSWRFVQAAGCLARTLGGRLQNLDPCSGTSMPYFGMIKPAAHEGKNISTQSRFCYDFLKAILLWLEGGKRAVFQGFQRPSNVSVDSPRFPISQDEDLENFVPSLERYFMQLADEMSAILDIDRNVFERDEIRQVFPSQKAAVVAFIKVLTDTELETRQGLSGTRTDPAHPDIAIRVMDRGAAARFWGVKVGRALLLSAAEGVTYDFTNHAFGGIDLEGEESDMSEDNLHVEVNSNEDERIVEALDIVASIAYETPTGNTQQIQIAVETPVSAGEEPNRADEEMRQPPTVHIEDVEDEAHMDVASEDDNDENDVDDSDSEHGTDDEEEEEEDPAPIALRRRLGLLAPRNRNAVNAHVPYSSHTRMYKGHCNARTVKDVNYYGLNDEYVVSGSDDGYFFIWDRKTSKILNILEGDGEIVNVVQGHPYEPMIACSGIDSTVKIFGPAGDNRERHAAERGIDVANPGGSAHSSLRFGGRRSARHANGENEEGDEDNEGSTSRGLTSRRAVHRSYEITSQNDVGRRRNEDDGFGTVISMEELLARAWIMSTLRMN